MAKLTDGRAGTVSKAEPPLNGTRFIFDDHRASPPGFALRVTKAGGKAFVLRYTLNRRQRLKTIGKWPVWSLEAARTEAQDLARSIARGTDPLEQDDKRKLAPTVAEVADEWLDRHATGLKSEKAIRGFMLNDLVPAIGRMKLSEVRRRHVLELVEAKAETAPRAAANILLYTRKMFDYATDRDMIQANPLAGLKPSSVTVKGKRNALAPKARTRVLDSIEIRRVWHDLERSGVHRLTALALKLVLITGQRPGEVAGMSEREIKGRTWTIPADRRGKTETEHSVHLTDTALAILAAARAERNRISEHRSKEANAYVFEIREGSPVTVRALNRAVARRADLLCHGNSKWTPHDLRRTMRTGLSACGIRPDIAELVIGHTKRGIIAVYDQHAYETEMSAALVAWEDRLLETVAGADTNGFSEDRPKAAGQ